MFKFFPPIEREMEKGGEDHNPGIQLFGRRFFADQTVPELLIELLLVATSPKKVGDRGRMQEGLLPDLELLRSSDFNGELKYAPKARLNLKLFAFLGASKLETRHKSHRQHYSDLISILFP